MAFLGIYFISGFIFPILEAFFNALPLTDPYGYDEENGKWGFTELMQTIFSCCAYLVIGKLLAPKYKNTVSFILLSILIVFMILNMIFKIRKRINPIYEILAYILLGSTISGSFDKLDNN